MQQVFKRVLSKGSANCSFENNTILNNPNKEIVSSVHSVMMPPFTLSRCTVKLNMKSNFVKKIEVYLQVAEYHKHT